MRIVLCGVKGSGKDTVGDLLVIDHDFKKYAFATPLKKMVLHAFPGFSFDAVYGPSNMREEQYEQYPFSGICVSCGFECGKIGGDGYVELHYSCRRCLAKYPAFINPRIALQTLGTEWGRRLYKNVWIDAAFAEMQEVDDSLSRSHNWVVTDGRFRNEVERTRELSGVAVLLTRGLKESTDPHPSEAELRSMDPKRDFDFVFDNANLTLSDLPRAVELLVRDLAART